MYVLLKTARSMAIRAHRHRFLLVSNNSSHLGDVTFDRGFQILIGETFDQFRPAEFSLALAERAAKYIIVVSHDGSFGGTKVRAAALARRRFSLEDLERKWAVTLATCLGEVPHTSKCAIDIHDDCGK